MSGGLHERNRAPYAPQDPTQIADCLEHMKGGSKQKGARYKSRTYAVSDGSGRTVESWKLNEWDYKKSFLPTYARGLFTHQNNRKPEIAARGYDKFFNVDEVRSTEWKNIETNTRGPYELSVKENGCIIFIAALDNDSLLVASKHSTGDQNNEGANHSMAGEAWLDRQLGAIGKTRADLAKRLRSMNATAVAELCDDEFEEHVLEYKPEAAGLYLHGINLNLPDFATYSGTLTDTFADEWGFRKVMYVVKHDIREVRSFLEQVGETGHYNGRDTEGFVVRCQKREAQDGLWQDWFFKYKFEEPYLMYRQWREVTKAIINSKAPRYKKHKQITQQYILYARRQLAKNPELGKRFNQNHGIIAMREGFLMEQGLRGSDIIRNEEEGGIADSDVTHNVVLVPIATIGCGKTTVALALTKLFGWGHVQNDNITGKGNRANRFAIACTTAMTSAPVLIADRNNHQRRERDQIIADIKKIVDDAKFVGLHWVHDRGNYRDIQKAMRNRIFSRGDNHQTIHAGSKSETEIVGIMDGFMKRFEPCDTKRSPDDQFDLVLNLDPTVDSRDNLFTVVHGLHAEFPKLFEMPSEEEMDAAIEWALSDYKPELKHDLSSSKQVKQEQKFQRKQDKKQTAVANGPGKSKPTRIEYFQIALPPDRVISIVDAVFKDADAETKKFYTQLCNTRRIQQAFHVTLIHRASIAENQDYWNSLSALWTRKQAEAKTSQDGTNGPRSWSAADTDPSSITEPIPQLDLGTSRVQLERVVWDDRVMAILVRLPDAAHNGFRTTNQMAHVTVGTAGEHIKPKEAGDLLVAWENGTRAAKDVRVKGNVVLDGIVRGVVSR
ncbi:MAG: hypothetical protein Q9159_001350 [Coniocarpon cinnabarinum]